MEGTFLTSCVPCARPKLFNSQKQDQYAVLGLSHLRYKATPEQIKVARTLVLPFIAILKISSLISIFADRKKVLKHHPDKKASSTSSEFSNSLYLTGVNQNTNDDAFFKCIQKAHEVLTNPEKRRQFDSVDPVFMEFEDEMPTASEIKVSLTIFL